MKINGEGVCTRMLVIKSFFIIIEPRKRQGLLVWSRLLEELEAPLTATGRSKWTIMDVRRAVGKVSEPVFSQDNT
jgi:hypothetical protein